MLLNAAGARTYDDGVIKLTITGNPEAIGRARAEVERAARERLRGAQ